MKVQKYFRFFEGLFHDTSSVCSGYILLFLSFFSCVLALQDPHLYCLDMLWYSWTALTSFHALCLLRLDFSPFLLNFCVLTAVETWRIIHCVWRYRWQSTAEAQWLLWKNTELSKKISQFSNSAAEDVFVFPRQQEVHWDRCTITKLKYLAKSLHAFQLNWWLFS